ncbi:MAG: hypothetical protein NTX25_20425, partial [Proteobacteria bacterium]|nr:hypothetical protein [Pseudomonadota bacterium]
MITNNSYLSGVVHRGMRSELLKTFSSCHALNLHGSALFNKSTLSQQDDNVFDIRAGVSILYAQKQDGQGSASVPDLKYFELLGTREHKYKFLDQENFSTTNWLTLKPSHPNFYFVPKSFGPGDAYNNLWSIKDIFKLNSLGIEFGSKEYFLTDDKDRIECFLESILFNASIKTEEISKTHGLKSTSGWRFESLRARELKKGLNKDLIVPCLSSPFDTQSRKNHQASEREGGKDVKI